MRRPAPATLASVLALVDAGPPRLSGGRLLCIDGPAGSGKTTLATAVSEERPGTLIHLDDLLAGWEASFPETVEALVTDVLAPLAADRAAAYRRYDWVTGRYAEWVPVPPSELLIVEGVSCGSVAVTAYAAALVWVEADPDRRRQRGLARDGEAFAPHWEAWARRENELFAAEHTRERAQLRLRT